MQAVTWPDRTHISPPIAAPRTSSTQESEKLSTEGSNTGSGAHRRPTVGVVRETNDGERRVALVPKIVPSLIAKGVDVVVEAGAGLGALIPDELYNEAGARSATRGPRTWSSRSRRRPTRRSPGSARDDADRFPRAAQRRQPDRCAHGGRRRGLRGRGHPAYLPRPGDGRAVVAGERVRLQGGAGGGDRSRRGSSRCSPPRRAP